MPKVLRRRDVAICAGGALVSALAAAPRSVRAAEDVLAPVLAAIEHGSGGRLGVAIEDTGTGRRFGHRAGERFPLCSTFKVLACAALLARVDAGHEDLGRRIRFTRAEVVTYSPVTQDRAGGDGMTLAELCAAAMTQSDNTAGNLILRSIGGPAGVTAYARAIGDPVTRLDRIETDLNEATPGDPRDTTAPDAMAANLRSLALGDRLSPASRGRLQGWLLACQTGGAKLRAGVPGDWRVGDKTGGGERGTTNDVAVLWPPGRAPLIACVYLTETTATFAARNATDRRGRAGPGGAVAGLTAGPRGA